jgi:transglutaminase-like putative cysteine protease
MKCRIQHTTRYTGSEPVSVGHNEAWLTPRTTPTQRSLSHRLQIIPEPSILSTRSDYFGNTVSQFSFNQGYDALTVTAVNEVEVHTPVRESDSPPWDDLAATLLRHETADDLAAFEFAFDSSRCRRTRAFRDYGRESFTPGRPVLEAVEELLQRFYTDFRYESGSTTVSTPVEQAFAERRGVCQDFAHLMISILRSLGLGARYVSGYLRTLPPPGKPRLVGADASHAWASVYAGRPGWVDLDPAIGKLAGTDHITVAWGRDYEDVAPLKGVYIGGGTHQLTVNVDVIEMHEPAAHNLNV